MGLTEPVVSRQPSAEPHHRSRRGWALALTSVAYFMVVLDALVVIAALPAIGRDLGGGMATLQWTVNAYTLTFAAGIITAAALGDRLGRRRVFAAGLALFTAANTTAYLMMAALLAAVFLASQYLQVARGVSPLGTGLRFLPWTGMPLLVAPAAGALSDRIGQRPLMAAGMLLQAVGLAWFALVATTSVSYWQLVGPLLVAGVGISMALPTTATAALSAVAPSDMGKASGANGTLQRFGGAFGIAASTAVFAANGQLGTPASFTAGFRPALTLAAGLSLLGVVSALAVSRDWRLPAATQPQQPAA